MIVGKRHVSFKNADIYAQQKIPGDAVPIRDAVRSWILSLLLR